jgi:hypothetical protein
MMREDAHGWSRFKEELKVTNYTPGQVWNLFKDMESDACMENLINRTGHEITMGDISFITRSSLMEGMESFKKK